MTETQQLDDSGESPQFAYFFLPLPEPLRLPNGFVLETIAPVNFLRLRALHDDAHTEPKETLLCSVRLLHVPVAGMPIYVPAVQAAMEAAERALPFLVGDRVGEGEQVGEAADIPNVTWTVAEVAVPLPDGADDGESDILREALDIAVEAVRSLQSAYYVATKEPVTLAARESLPPFIPFTLRWVNTGAPEDDRWDGGISLYVINDNVQSHVLGDDISSEELAMFEVVVATDRETRAFIGYADMWRDARIALHRRGDYRAAVVAAETAAQVLLDDLLLLMLWEERIAPGFAADHFRGQGLPKRVRTHYHDRLGGNWSTAQGPIADWLWDLSSVRHRVVHTGYTPTRKEARDALVALSGLESFVVDRLIRPDVIRRYPRTAMGLLGKPTLERGGRWDQWLADLAKDRREPDWVATFGRWRWVVEDTLEETVHPEPEGTDHLVSVLRVDLDGT